MIKYSKISNGMNLVLKYKKEILLSLLILIAFLVSRLIILGNFPIFTDEALYIRWAQIASQDASWRFISLTDGKQPMLIWFGMIFLRLIEDPIVAVRLVSVVAGLFSLIGLWLLSFELFKSKRVAFVSSILYVAYPFAVVYDRLALYDSLVGALAIYAIYFSILLVRKMRLDIAYTLGVILGAGMLTKTSANFSIILLPVGLILLNLKQKNLINKLIKWAIFALIAVVIAEVLYNTLRLSPFFHIIKEKNTIFVYYPFSIPIGDNINLFLGNLRGLLTWLFTYLTPFYLILILVSLLTRKFIMEKLLLIAYFSLPLIALALFGRVIFPRFIFFMSLYLLPLAALGLVQIIDLINNYLNKRKLNSYYVVSVLVILLFILYPMKVSMDFIFNPEKAAIANADNAQYISDWPAGGGVKESVKFFEEKSKNEKIFIGTEGTFGLLPYALEIYLANNPNITIKGYWPIERIPEEALESAKKMPTYFIFYQPCIECEFSGDAPNDWPLKKISEFKKNDRVYYTVYSVDQK